jgi:hypothetical protein
MTKSPAIIGTACAAALTLLTAPSAMARGTNPPQTSAMASGHMSTQGTANSNGPSASDRDTGLNRAEDRMSQQGLAQNRALKKKHISDHDADDLTKAK